ncbi:MAG: hypothetical protein HY246_08150, partial [Proteobacteria bacterium]|nr:hypothetical protein [Pseudomonadota bacterium]
MAVGHKVEDSLPNQAVALLDYTRRLDRHRTGRRAVYMHLSKLRPYNRREQHLRIAYNTLETLVQAHEGQIFALANADVVLLCKGATVADMDAVILKVRFLFNEDPLVMGDDGDAKKRFCDWFDLEQDYPTFLAHVENLLAALAAEERRRSSDVERQAARREPPLQTLDPRELARIQDALTRADLSAVMRRQAVCILVGDQPPQLVYNEVFVSIADLQQVIAPKTNLTSNRWLFQYLTETLDKRLLALLPRIDDSSIASRFALNLNVASVLSPQFLAFDTSLRAG